jgi:hypothetical protein
MSASTSSSIKGTKKKILKSKKHLQLKQTDQSIKRPARKIQRISSLSSSIVLDKEMEEEQLDTKESEEDEEITSPVVFQCGTCRCIFGDSYGFVCSNADLLLVTLCSVTNVNVLKEAHTSQEGLDMGSSFREIVCIQCQAALGKLYLTTPQSLDAIRGMYSFSTPCISSYQLGTSQLQESDNNNISMKEAIPRTLEELNKATKQCVNDIHTLSHDRQAIQSLQDDMVKVQNLLLIIDERLQQLEHAQHSENDEEEEEQEEDGGEGGRRREEDQNKEMVDTKKEQPVTLGGQASDMKPMKPISLGIGNIV